MVNEADIFSEYRQAFEYCEKLKLCGESESARTLATMCARKAASYCGVDLIELFYGAGAYQGIADCSDAIVSVFLCACLKRVYDAMLSKSPLKGAAPWARQGKTADGALKRFFTFASAKGRRLNVQDYKILREACAAIAGGEACYPVARRLESRSLQDIVRGLTNGTVSMDYNGGLV